MREVGDGFDLMVTVIALILMLSVCTWSLASIRSSQEIAVDEKTAIHNVYGQAIEKPVQTAKDALMSLVVNDAYLPDPNTIVFQLGHETYAIVFDNAYFHDKEASINKAWDEFFKDKMNATIESTTLDPTGTRWIVKLVP